MLLKSWRGLAAVSIFIILSIATARADGGVDDLSRLIGKTGTESQPLATVTPVENDAPLRLTSNKNQIIRLDQDAASVIVNNPAHAEIMLDSPRLLIVMPRQPGTTSFTVLDARGETILQKDIIVSNVKAQYVRVRKMCAANDSSCVPAAYYYCPDGCYEVTPIAAGAAGTTPPPAGAPSSAASTTPDPAASQTAPSQSAPSSTSPEPAPSEEAAPEEGPLGPTNEPNPPPP